MVATGMMGKAPNLDIGYLFGKGWQTFKDNVGLGIGMWVLVIVITSIGNGSRGMDGGGGVSGILSLAALIISGPLYAGYYNSMLRMIRGEQVEFARLFSGFSKFGNAVGVYLLSLLIIIVGLVLLVVPGVVLALGFFAALFLIMEEDLSVTDTLKRSWGMTAGYKLKLFVLFIVLGLFNILGLLALFIGLLVTAPITMLILAAVYDELAGPAPAEPVTEATPVEPPEATPIG